MKTTFRITLSLFAFLCLFFGTGCATAPLFKTNTMIASAVTVDKAVEGRPSVGAPISMKDSRVVMMPFAVEHQKAWFEKDTYNHNKNYYEVIEEVALYERSGSSIPHAPPASYSHGIRWNNVIFKDLDSGKDWLLLDRRGVIVGYRVLGPTKKKAIPEKKGEYELEFTPVETFFEVTMRDTDGDGVLTRNDVTQIVASGVDGANIREVTPPDVDIISYYWDDEVDEMFLRGRADTNKDGRFDGLDESEPYILKPGASQAVSLVSESIQQRADGLLR